MRHGRLEDASGLIGASYYSPLFLFRRLKVRLGHYSWAEVQKAVGAGRALTVHLRLTDGRGGPLCATPPATHLRWDPPSKQPPRVRRARG